MRTGFMTSLLVIVLGAAALSGPPASASIDEDQAMSIAMQAFESNVPAEVRDEYKLTGFKKLDSGPYQVTWWRHINGIISEDNYLVWIDEETGELQKNGLVYTYPTREIDTIPTLSEDQAVFVVMQAYGPQGFSLARELEEPQLVIRGKSLHWEIVIAKGLHSVAIEIDADTGETVRRSPSTTAGGGSFTQAPTKWDPLAYYTDVYGPYLFLAALVLIGGAAFFKKDRLAKLLKKR